MQQKVATPSPRSPLRCAVLLAWGVVMAAAFGAASPPPETSRRPGGRLGPDRAFADVWVVERGMAEVYEALARLTAPDRFDPIVIAGGEDEATRAPELDHLLAILPEGTSHWVGDGPVPVGLNVDAVTSPATLADPDDELKVVFCPDPELNPLAALIAMRLDATLTGTPPAAAGELAVQVGGAPLEPWLAASSDAWFIADADAALELANSMAGRDAVMVFKSGALGPELVLHAFQRDLLLVPVAPPPYSSYDVRSENAATLATRDQIHAGLADLGFDLEHRPEALVVAGGWSEIPYRFARSLVDDCAGCDNGVYEHAADVEYANLDPAADPWGEPEVPVGRLMSYERDLLALTTVLGVWHDQGAFPAPGKAALLDLLPAPWRDAALATWQDRFADRQWHRFGPEELNAPFALDREALFADADDADLLLVRAHGAPNALATLTARQLDGSAIAASAGAARPAFWLIDACATARFLDPSRFHPGADRTGNNLVTGIQRRLALGAWLSVEVVGQGSSSLWWPTVVVEPGLTAGELARRATVAAITAYRRDREGFELPEGLPGLAGLAANLHNARTPMLWIGDPLTHLDPSAPEPSPLTPPDPPPTSGGTGTAG